MSTATAKKNHHVNPNASTRKKVDTKGQSSKKEEKKETFVSLAGASLKKLHEKTTKPLWNSIKGGYSKISEKIKNRYESEKETYKQIGFWRYLMDITGRVAIKVAKMGAVVTIAFLLNELVFNYAGFSILDPMTLMIAAGVGLLAVIIGSVMTQKDEGTKVTANRVGNHIVEAFAA